MFANLNKKGKDKLIASLGKHGTPAVVENLTDQEALDAWEQDVEQALDLDGFSHLEIGSSFTKTKTPVVINFSPEDFSIDEDRRNHNMEQFVEACFNDNSIEELRDAIGKDDLSDRRAWGLYFDDYQKCLNEALALKLEESK